MLGCEPAPPAGLDELRQELAEVRAEVAALRRTVARLEQAAEAQSDQQPGALKAPEPNKTQCSGTTKAGARCKRLVAEGERLCWQHGG